MSNTDNTERKEAGEVSLHIQFLWEAYRDSPGNSTFTPLYLDCKPEIEKIIRRKCTSLQGQYKYDVIEKAFERSEERLFYLCDNFAGRNGAKFLTALKEEVRYTVPYAMAKVNGISDTDWKRIKSIKEITKTLGFESAGMIAQHILNTPGIVDEKPWNRTWKSDDLKTEIVRLEEIQIPEVRLEHSKKEDRLTLGDTIPYVENEDTYFKFDNLDDEQREVLSAAIGQLSKDERDAFEEFYFSQEKNGKTPSFKAVGQALGISTSKAKKLIKKTDEKLEQIVPTIDPKDLKKLTLEDHGIKFSKHDYPQKQKLQDLVTDIIEHGGDWDILLSFLPPKQNEYLTLLTKEGLSTKQIIQKANRKKRYINETVEPAINNTSKIWGAIKGHHTDKNSITKSFDLLKSLTLPKPQANLSSNIRFIEVFVKFSNSPKKWNQAVNSLTKNHKNLLDMFYINGLNQTEIAEKLRLASPNINRKLNTIFSKLEKKYLEDSSVLIPPPPHPKEKLKDIAKDIKKHGGSLDLFFDLLPSEQKKAVASLVQGNSALKKLLKKKNVTNKYINSLLRLGIRNISELWDSVKGNINESTAPKLFDHFKEVSLPKERSNLRTNFIKIFSKFGGDKEEWNKANDTLEERERIALDMFYKEGEKNSKIAEKLDVVEGTSYRILNSAISKLGKHWEATQAQTGELSSNSVNDNKPQVKRKTPTPVAA